MVVVIGEGCQKQPLSRIFQRRLRRGLHLAACLLSMLGVLEELVWLARQIAQQLLCWEEVKGRFDDWKVGAAAATKAGHTGASKAVCDYDPAVFECYLEQGRQFSSLVGGRSSLPGADTLLCEAYAVETVELLLARFGCCRVLSWARALNPFPWVEEGAEPNDDRILGMITSGLGLAAQAEAVGELSHSYHYLPQHVLAVGIAEILLAVVPNLACGVGQQAAGSERDVRAQVQDVMAGPLGGGRGSSYLFLLEVISLVVVSLKICPARGCCNNPRCMNLGGVGEKGLVVGREGARGVCSGCREVCYCSRECQEAAWVLLHKDWCSQYRYALLANRGELS